jgi:hypothetical protein
VAHLNVPRRKSQFPRIPAGSTGISYQGLGSNGLQVFKVFLWSNIFMKVHTLIGGNFMLSPLLIN